MIRRGRYFITFGCNLNCWYCLSRSGTPHKNEKTPDELLPIFEAFAKAGVKQIGISGGEPFLVYDRTKRAVEILSDLGMRVRVFTNGTVTQYGMIEGLINAGVSGFHVSVDGNKPHHDAVRGDGAWIAAIKTIFEMKRFGTHVRTVSVLTPENLPDAEDMVELLLAMGVDEIFLKTVNTSIGRADGKENSVDMRSLKHLLIHPQVTIKEYGNFKAKCDAVAVDADGKIISCGQVQEPFGDGLEGNIDKILNKVSSERTCHFRDITTGLNGAGEVCCDY